MMRTLLLKRQIAFEGEYFDLKDILGALGPAALGADWRLSDVEAVGEGETRFDEWSAAGRAVPGAELLDAAQSVIQTIDGWFRGFRPGQSVAWVEVRAIDGSFFEVSSEDSEVFESLGEFPRVAE